MGRTRRDINTTELLHQALEYEITFVPSEEFACNSFSKTFNGMRLNFTNSDLPTIAEGIKILGLLIKNFKIKQKHFEQS
jgi:DNA-binding transcriptional MocR family regulator